MVRGGGRVVVVSGRRDEGLVETAAELLRRLCVEGVVYASGLSTAERKAAEALMRAGVLEARDGFDYGAAVVYSTIGGLALGPMGIILGIIAAGLTSDEKHYKLRDEAVCSGKAVVLDDSGSG